MAWNGCVRQAEHWHGMVVSDRLNMQVLHFEWLSSGDHAAASSFDKAIVV
jgi:transposase